MRKDSNLTRTWEPGSHWITLARTQSGLCEIDCKLSFLYYICESCHPWIMRLMFSQRVATFVILTGSCTGLWMWIPVVCCLSNVVRITYSIWITRFNPFKMLNRISDIKNVFNHHLDLTNTLSGWSMTSCIKIVSQSEETSKIIRPVLENL